MKHTDIKKIVLAYSGGLDTSIIIPWLKENYNNPEIIAVAGNVGQADELEGLEEKAIKTGASKLIVADLVDEMVDDVIIPCLKMDAKYETYLLGTEPEVYAVYTVKGGTKQEKTSVRVEAKVTGLAQLLDGSTGVELEAAKAAKPKSRVLWLLGISLGSTAAAAAVTLVVVRLLAKRKKRRAGRR